MCRTFREFWIHLLLSKTLQYFEYSFDLYIRMIILTYSYIHDQKLNVDIKAAYKVSLKIFS